MTVLRRWSDFKGRSRRKEYWYFALVLFIVSIVFQVLFYVLRGAGGVGALLGGIIELVYSLIVLAILVPSIAVSIRRLHDTGRSGWWLLLSVVPIASLVLLFFFCLDSDPAMNKWGPNPKGLADADFGTTAPTILQ